MTLSPKVKAEIHSVAVSFITAFVAALAPALAVFLKSGNTITIAEVTALLYPILRIAVKSAYSQFISDYTTQDVIQNNG